MAENIRLVIWDLDDTFWRGTVTEGGMQQYVQENHNIVIELARRGIVSSICSKNDRDTIIKVLSSHEILDYFVFVSISWTPKGPRIKQLIEDSQLRPSTVMFIDDNPVNRAEAKAHVPDLQVESEALISSILSDSRFEGKADTELTRLKQYRMLDKRKIDQQQATEGNEEFLRRAGIKVFLDYDVASNIDRAIELINRTNQLNYTKKRLSEDINAARTQLRSAMSPFDCITALVRVVDNYGDHGFVGFFLAYTGRQVPDSGNSNLKLVHYCFSCRLLGYFIERWIFDFLGRPELEVVGDVLTDLSTPQCIDWISNVDNLESSASYKITPVAPRIVTFGGCEMQTISSYLAAHTEELCSYGSYAAGGIFSRINAVTTAVDIIHRDKAEFAAEAEILGLPFSLETVNMFERTEIETVFVFNITYDAYNLARIRHKKCGWMPVIEPRSHPGINFLELEKGKLKEILSEKNYTEDQVAHITRVFDHVHREYELVPALGYEEFEDCIRTLIEYIPQGSKLILCVHHDQYKEADGTITARANLKSFSRFVRTTSSDYDFVGAMSYAEAIDSEADLRDADHLQREVYLRIAKKILDIAKTLKGKSVSQGRLKNIRMKALQSRKAKKNAESTTEFVVACYQQLLRRDPDPSSAYYVDRLLNGSSSYADVLRSISQSSEFSSKWRAV